MHIYQTNILNATRIFLDSKSLGLLCFIHSFELLGIHFITCSCRQWKSLAKPVANHFTADFHTPLVRACLVAVTRHVLDKVHPAEGVSSPWDRDRGWALLSSLFGEPRSVPSWGPNTTSAVSRCLSQLERQRLMRIGSLWKQVIRAQRPSWYALKAF